MRRRDLIAFVAAATLYSPFVARAQQNLQARRISVIVGTGNDAQGQTWIAAFQDQLKKLGWIEGRNIQVDLVWGGADINRIRAAVTATVNSRPNAIVVYSVRVLNIVREMTKELPVVFIATNDPVGLGIVQSLSHPGGNLTGFMLYEVSVAGKLVELLKEILPSLARVALLYNPTNSSAMPYWRLIQNISKANGITPVSFPVHDPASIELAFATFAREPNGGVVLPADATTTTYLEQIAEMAARHRLPVIYSFNSIVASGGLIAYGPDTSDLFRRSAVYVDRVLKGEQPSTLPVQAPEKFTLAVNLKAARILNLTVPTSILLRADEVIE